MEPQAVYLIGTGGITLAAALSASADSGGAAGNVTVVAAVPGKRIMVLGFYLSAAASVTIAFTDGTGGASLSGPLRLPTNGSMVVPFTDGPALFGTSAGNALVMNTGGAVAAGGLVQYVIQ